MYTEVNNDTMQQVKISKISSLTCSELLVGYRQECGMMQAEVARLSEVPVRFISQLERGIFEQFATMPLEECHAMLGQICEVIHAPVDDAIVAFDVEYYKVIETKRNNASYADTVRDIPSESDNIRNSFSSYLISGVLILVVVLIIANWISHRYASNEKLKEFESIDYGEFVPDPKLKMDVLAIPSN